MRPVSTLDVGFNVPLFVIGLGAQGSKRDQRVNATTCIILESVDFVKGMIEVRKGSTLAAAVHVCLWTSRM